MRFALTYLLTLGLLLSPLAIEQPLAASPSAVQFEWESRNSALLNDQRNFLTARGGQVGPVWEKDPDTKNPLAILLYVTVGVAGRSALADAIVKTLKDAQHGGLIVDMQRPTIKIIESQSVERGQVLVRMPNGDVESPVQKSGSSSELSSIIASLLASAKQP
ncbi:MAG: hypothetical protein MRJ68_16175 [Nitrospira sp.]|nr:hypothetical protein [Nitrospira sp.]